MNMKVAAEAMPIPPKAATASFKFELSSYSLLGSSDSPGVGLTSTGTASFFILFSVAK